MTNFKAYFYNEFDFYRESGSFTWTKPSDIDETKPILVHVWGAGGQGADAYDQAENICNGGGGGGLAVKLIDVSALGTSETVTIGAGNVGSTGQGGASSFGSHCSATGANGGLCVTTNAGSNGGGDGVANYGIGGMGSGGDANRRGGVGGTGYYSDSTNNGGGGGGSAPAPYGYRDGFKGGNGGTYAGGGGGSIGSEGMLGSYRGGSGGGTMSKMKPSNSPNSYFTPAAGGNGLLGTGGCPAGAGNSYLTYGGDNNKDPAPPTGDLILTPNEIACYGGGGNGHIYWYNSSERTVVSCTDGAPGAGGGGLGKYTTTGAYWGAGAGGFLGGGGGACNYSSPGAGGNAGGSGGNGYYFQGTTRPLVDRFRAGNGVVLIQYARLV